MIEEFLWTKFFGQSAWVVLLLMNYSQDETRQNLYCDISLSIGSRNNATNCLEALGMRRAVS